MIAEHTKAILGFIAGLATVIGFTISGTLFYVKFERRIEAIEQRLDRQSRQMQHIANRNNKDIYIDE